MQKHTPRHGLIARHRDHGCLCVECITMNGYTPDLKRFTMRHRPIPPHVHGTTNGAVNYRCNCEPCKTAQAHYNRRHYHQAKAAK